MLAGMENGTGAAVRGTQAAGGGTRRYTVAQAARRLGLSERGIRRRIETGTLAAERTAHGWRITADALAAAMDASQDGTEAALGGTASAANGTEAAEGGTGAAFVPPDTAERLAVAEAVLAEVRGERDELRERLRQAEQERAELRRLLAGALQRPALAPGIRQADTGAAAEADTQIVEQPPRPWWARFWPWRPKHTEQNSP
jgi:excisionase family DNA binding protein